MWIGAGEKVVYNARMRAADRNPFALAARIIDNLLPKVDLRRPSQHPPPGDWRVWLLHPGRGWGKGFTAAHWLRDRVYKHGAKSIALVGSSQGHARQVMVEQPESGILAICPEATYKRTAAEVHWPNGAVAYMCSAENADEPPLRGGNFDTAWADEVDSWGKETTSDKAELAWENLTLSVRKGDSRMIVTSTPKPGRVVSALLRRAKLGSDVVVTTGSTYENTALSPQFVESVEKLYRGTQIERQEIYGEVLDEIHGALWRLSSFQYREIEPEELARVVIGVDPSGGGDEIGIVAAGELAEVEDEYAVLEDRSLLASPEEWADVVSNVYDRWGADLIVAEKNYGGDMVASTIRASGRNLPVKLVSATRGKSIRAEPISLLYDQDRVWHRRGEEVRLDILEGELMKFTRQRWEGKGSPNHADAAIWALTELALEARTPILLKPIWGTRSRHR